MSHGGGYRPDLPNDAIFVVLLFLRFFFFFLFSFRLTFTFQLLDKLWSQVSSLLPPGMCLQFLSRIGLSIPTARRLSSNVANSRTFALSASQFVHKKKSLRIYSSITMGGLELTQLTYSRHEHNVLHHRRDRVTLTHLCNNAVRGHRTGSNNSGAEDYLINRRKNKYCGVKRKIIHATTVSDTWKCGSLSFIFTHPPEDLKKNKKKQTNKTNRIQ